MKRILCIFGSLFMLTAAAVAQTPVKNPTTAVITVSPDHGQVTKYQLGWFITGATDPVQVADVGTGTPVNNEISKPLPSYPIGVTYTARARAYVNDIASDWSPASNPFYRTPSPPPVLVIR